MAKTSLILGTAVKITVNLSVATPTAATITIKDATNNTKVENASMTKIADYVYRYVYQTLSTDDYGDWQATISVTSDGYTSVSQAYFTMIDQENNAAERYIY